MLLIVVHVWDLFFNTLSTGEIWVVITINERTLVFHEERGFIENKDGNWIRKIEGK